MQIKFSDGTSPDLRYSYGAHSTQGTSSKMEDRVVLQDWSHRQELKGGSVGGYTFQHASHQACLLAVRFSLAA